MEYHERIEVLTKEQLIEILQNSKQKTVKVVIQVTEDHKYIDRFNTVNGAVKDFNTDRAILLNFEVSVDRIEYTEGGRVVKVEGQESGTVVLNTLGGVKKL